MTPLVTALIDAYRTALAFLQTEAERQELLAIVATDTAALQAFTVEAQTHDLKRMSPS